jgi:hypothetical protein
MAFCNIIVPGETGFYRGEKNICREIQQLVIDSCMGQCRGTRQSSWMEAGINGKTIYVDLVDPMKEKIVNVEIVEKRLDFTRISLEFPMV